MNHHVNCIMRRHLLIKSFLRESNETNSFSWMFLHSCHNQFKQFVKNSFCSCFIIKQHPIIHLNHLLTMSAQTHDVHLFLLCPICENILLYIYMCSWKKCTNTLSIWHHMCLSARKRNHKKTHNESNVKTYTGELANNHVGWRIIKLKAVIWAFKNGEKA